MDQIKIIPHDLLRIIPKFEGQESILNMYLRKCQYIYDAFADANNPAQETYIFHALSSRLYGKAASLISVREDIETWDELKTILIQYFGDMRTEELIALELEQMKIMSGESYTDFYRRIQLMFSTLLAKMKEPNEEVKATKVALYKNMAFKVFLFNLSENLVQLVRHKQCNDLESALKVVIEQENFMKQFRVKSRQNYTEFRPNVPQPVCFPQGTGFFGGQPASNSSTGLFSAQPSFGFGTATSKPAGTTFGAPSSQLDKGNAKSMLFGIPPQTVSIASPPKATKNAENADSQ